MGNNLNLNILSKISLELDDLLLPYTFALSLFYQISNAELIDHINHVGIVLLHVLNLNKLYQHRLDQVMDSLKQCNCQLLQILLLQMDEL